jgi:hypothetical protein
MLPGPLAVLAFVADFVTQVLTDWIAWQMVRL